MQRIVHGLLRAGPLGQKRLAPLQLALRKLKLGALLDQACLLRTELGPDLHKLCLRLRQERLGLRHCSAVLERVYFHQQLAGAHRAAVHEVLAHRDHGARHQRAEFHVALRHHLAEGGDRGLNVGKLHGRRGNGPRPLLRPLALDLGPRRLQVADRKHRAHQREQRQHDLQRGESAGVQATVASPCSPTLRLVSADLVPLVRRGDNRGPTSEW